MAIARFESLFLVLFVIWLSLYGVAMIVGQQGRYVQATRQAVRWVWRRFRFQIIWMTVGAVLALSLFT